MNKIAVYVLSRNRKEYLGACIASIAQQDYKDFDLIISDNSSLPEMDDHLSQVQKSVTQVIKRRPNLQALQHFNAIIQEACAKYEYVVLFHDDDLMGPRFLSSCVEMVARYPDVAAVATNAELLYSDSPEHKKNGTLFYKIRQNLFIRTPFDLVARYAFPSLLGFPPFPSYFYKTEFLRNARMGPEFGGKYSDVGLLAQILQYGQVLWLPEPSMTYRFHSSNDSNDTSPADAFRLHRFLILKFPLTFPIASYFLIKKIVKHFISKTFKI